MNMLRFFFFILFVLATANVSFAGPEIPGAPQRRPVALVNATIHPVEGDVIENGVMLFEKGKIVGLGRNLKVPDGTQVMDLKGKHVYPSMIESLSNIGLVEINAVRATRDFEETGDVNPNVRANRAFNPDSELIPVTRSNGVLISVSAPTGHLISGQSAVMQLDGWTFEDMTVKSPAAMHIRWPAMSPTVDWHTDETPAEQIKERNEQLEKLQQVFDDARLYQQARRAGEKQPVDLRLKAMLPVINGETPVMVTANDIRQIQAAVAFAAREKIKLIIYGGYDAMHCAELLKKTKTPVVIGGVYRTPRRRGEAYDSPYTLAARLQKAGVTFCISGAGRFGASNARNLPYHASMAAAHGLPREEALRAITLYPAQILGIANRVGSLSPGKDATFFVSSGDPLETDTQVEMAFVQGRQVDLSDRHKRLYQKYRERLRRQQAAEAGGVR